MSKKVTPKLEKSKDGWYGISLKVTEIEVKPSLKDKNLIVVDSLKSDKSKKEGETPSN